MILDQLRATNIDLAQFESIANAYVLNNNDLPFLMQDLQKIHQKMRTLCYAMGYQMDVIAEETFLKMRFEITQLYAPHKYLLQIVNTQLVKLPDEIDRANWLLYTNNSNKMDGILEAILIYSTAKDKFMATYNEFATWIWILASKGAVGTSSSDSTTTKSWWDSLLEILTTIKGISIIIVGGTLVILVGGIIYKVIPNFRQSD